MEKANTRNRRSKAKAKVEGQPRIPGLRRIPRHTAVLPTIEAAIEAEAAYYGVSRSWVVAVCCAIALEVDLETEQTYKPRLRVMRGGKR